MTLDISIGKIVIEQDENGRAYIWVKRYPDADFNVCNPKATITPKEAYRSGSTAFWQFWKKNDKLATIYERMREYPDSNDSDVTFLKSYVDDILNLSDALFSNPNDKDRLKWLKHWVKKAVELYGDEAGISFS